MSKESTVKKKVVIFSEENDLLYHEIQRLQSENEQLRKEIELLKNYTKSTKQPSLINKFRK